MGVRANAPPSPSLPSPYLPSPLSLLPLCFPCGRGAASAWTRKKKIKLKKKLKKLKIKFGSCCRLGKREKIYNFRFSIAKIPELPEFIELPELPELPELRGLRGRSREKKKVFSA
jgi:hypothetical protein